MFCDSDLNMLINKTKCPLPYKNQYITVSEVKIAPGVIHLQTNMFRIIKAWLCNYCDRCKVKVRHCNINNWTEKADFAMENYILLGLLNFKINKLS